MKPKRKSLTLILMTSSIMLLLVFQSFWLTNAYEKASFDLRRRTTTLFKGTVFALRDSFFVRNVEIISADSLRKHFVDNDTIFNERGENQRAPRPRNEDAHVQVLISTTARKPSDTLSIGMLRPVISKIQREHRRGRNKFLIRMGADSLNNDSIRFHFQQTLLKENIEGSFRIKHLTTTPRVFEPGLRGNSMFHGIDSDSTKLKEYAFTDTLVSDWVHYNPLHQYAVELFGFRSSIFREILPQVLFSVFLTMMTLASFFVLYKSILSQERLMELKNGFISNMTHELKTPIATVSVALEALKNFNDIHNPKKMAEYLDMAQHELNRLTILTDNVLTTSLFDDHGVSYMSAPIDLQRAIEQALASLKLVFEKTKASVHFEKHGHDFTISGSSIHLTNVIYNLLDNALKYSIAPAHIFISLNDKNENIQLIVKDHGIGIAAEFKDKIFEKFFRVPTGDIHNNKGYGLGLSYVHRVIREHGGTIHVESEPGTGTLFMITLPKKLPNN